MKQYLLTLIVLCIASVTFAQNDVTKFMGIPVDGTKSEMIRKLKEKGFTSNAYAPDILEGEFNGKPVIIGIQTNNNKVCRIMVKENVEYDEQTIKIRYNQLCGQFERNPKYIKLTDDEYTISDDARIYYEMIVNKKQYQAAYVQHTINKRDSSYMEMMHNPEVTSEMLEAMASLNKSLNRLEDYNKFVWFTISEEYGKYTILIFYDNEYNRANGEDL